MKKLITLLGFFPWILINGQDIDFSHFSEERMNEVMLINLNYYIKSQGGDSVIRSLDAQKSIYRCIKRNNEKVALDSLSSKINNEILTEYDSPSYLRVGILDSIPSQDIKTYQDIVIKCITDWTNSPSDAFFLIGWGKKVVVISFYNNRTNAIYISVVFKS
jgi:hypothetical protein